MLGFWVGARLRKHLSGPLFRNIVLAAFFVAGIRMVASAVMS
jgi:uncharacterized membrane protein YfcA